MNRTLEVNTFQRTNAAIGGSINDFNFGTYNFIELWLYQTSLGGDLIVAKDSSNNVALSVTASDGDSFTDKESI